MVVGVLFCRAFQVLGFSRFPIREYGMNYDSQPLQTHEIESMKADPIILERVIKSYQLMLDFYGMHLVSKETGLVERALPPRCFAPRYRNLVRELRMITLLSHLDLTTPFTSSFYSRFIAQLPTCFPNSQMFIGDGTGISQRWIFTTCSE